MPPVDSSFAALGAPMDLGPAVRQAAARFAHDLGTGSAAEALGVELPASLDRAVAKRRAEYAAGRRCALDAVRALRPGFAGQIASDDRAPRWPDGIVGSITHTDHFAWAAAGLTSSVRGIGVDSEVIPSAEAVDAIRKVATAPDDAPPGLGLDEPTHYALLFSAKESLFKCLYPIVRQMFWYEDAGLRFDHAARRFVAKLRIDLGADLVRGVEVVGSYVVDADARVHTAVVLARG
jgi:enterobactin synthetase component D